MGSSSRRRKQLEQLEREWDWKRRRRRSRWLRRRGSRRVQRRRSEPRWIWIRGSRRIRRRLQQQQRYFEVVGTILILLALLVSHPPLAFSRFYLCSRALALSADPSSFSLLYHPSTPVFLLFPTLAPIRNVKPPFFTLSRRAS